MEHLETPPVSNQPADLIRALRMRLNCTQEHLADQAGLKRVQYVQLETGHNKASSYLIRDGLAKAVDVPINALAEYLDGKLELKDLMRLRGTYATGDWWRPLVRAQHNAEEAEPSPPPRSGRSPKR